MAHENADLAAHRQDRRLAAPVVVDGSAIGHRLQEERKLRELGRHLVGRHDEQTCLIDMRAERCELHLDHAAGLQDHLQIGAR
jgi:hypothetical protein